MNTPSDTTLSLFSFSEPKNDAAVLTEQMNNVESEKRFDSLQQKMVDMKLTQEKQDNERFFASLAELMRQKLDADEFSRRLHNAAQDSGYSNTEEALNRATNSSGQSPLTHALRSQDFTTAKRLIDEGERVSYTEKAMFEIARDSKAAEDFGLSRPEPSQALHSVKYFGLTLDINMTARDGTSSQYGHVGPTYQVMTDSVSHFADRHPENVHFKEISDAFTFSNKAARYENTKAHGSGEDISARIQSGKTTTIPINCQGHAMGLSFVSDKPPSTSGYLIFTNRGEGAKPGEYGTSLYKVDDKSKITPEFIRTMMNGHNNGAPHSAIMSKMHEVTGGKPAVHHISQSGQRNDNCTIANSRSNIHGILLAMKAVEKGGIDKMDAQDFDAVKAEYKQYKTEMLQEKVQELISAIQKNPKNDDLINLGKEYLKQHPNASDKLKEPLETALKNTSLDSPQENRGLHN